LTSRKRERGFALDFSVRKGGGRRCADVEEKRKRTMRRVQRESRHSVRSYDERGGGGKGGQPRSSTLPGKREGKRMSFYLYMGKES